MEVVVASSPVDAGIGCWDLRTGAELLRHRPCASSPHGLLSLSRRFLVSSQLPDSPNAATAPIFLFSWDKPQVEVRGFPAEPIGPLAANSDGTYIVGGASSGTIYLWEVASGQLVNKWHAHYRSVTCLVFSDDESLLISGSEDGTVRVWPILKMFDDTGRDAARNPYLYSFSGHALRVTDIVGHGLCNSIIVSSSEDRTCKIWSLSKGRLLRSILFPCIIDAIVLDPGEHVFYAGGRDGKMYIGALTAQGNSNSSLGMFIIGSFSDHSKAITCLAFSTDGVTLVSGSEDGTVRIWDTKTQHVIRVLKHTKGPVNNVLIVREPFRSSHQASINPQVSLSKKRVRLLMPPPMDKYIKKTDGEIEFKAVMMLQPPDDLLDSRYRSSYVMKNQIKELQQQGSGAAEMELERSRQECKRIVQVAHKWKKQYQDLQDVCVDDLLNGNPSV